MSAVRNEKLFELMNQSSKSKILARQESSLQAP
jgi:hypothetical protein